MVLGVLGFVVNLMAGALIGAALAYLRVYLVDTDKAAGLQAGPVIIGAVLGAVVGVILWFNGIDLGVWFEPKHGPRMI
jgi:hypothetical protein